MSANYLYIIYQTTNLINGKIYVGKHKTTNLNDGYLGSGHVFAKALEKYGKESFSREVLFFCESQEEMDQKEAEIVNEDFLLRNDVYNITGGGRGGWSKIHKGSLTHVRNIKNVNEKIKNTCLEKYGAENPLCSKEIQEKVTATMLKRHGVKSPQKSAKIRGQTVNTCLERYGVESPLSSEEVKDKIKAKNMERRGFEYPTQSKDVLEKRVSTYLERYGASSPAGNIDVRNKMKATCLERYGVENGTQTPQAKEASRRIHKGSTRITNGVITKIVPKDSIIPEGWWKGVVKTEKMKEYFERRKGAQKGLVGYNNGTRRIYLREGDDIPEGFVKGHGPQTSRRRTSVML